MGPTPPSNLLKWAPIYINVSFSYKLNCSDFCCYCFSELMSIFFYTISILDILFVKIMNVTNCN